jgi:hypothetical protein
MCPSIVYVQGAFRAGSHASKAGDAFVIIGFTPFGINGAGGTKFSQRMHMLQSAPFRVGSVVRMPNRNTSI